MDNIHYWLAFGVFSVALYIALRRGADFKKTRPRHGISGYSIIYTDQRVNPEDRNPNTEYGRLLVSSAYGIQGKPDYIFKKNNGRDLIPVELKSGSIGDNPLPRQGDLMQLAAYFLIIEDVYGYTPRYGRLIYKDAMFIVKNTKSIRKLLQDTISRMEDMLISGEEDVHPSFLKCKNCICRTTVCEFASGAQK